MAIRLQEVHPSVVHFPIALLPASIAVDALGRVTGSQGLMDAGRYLMPAAAASAALAGAAGLIAQEAVRAEGRAHDQLATHRTLNAGVIGLTLVLANMRARQRRPSLGYLVAGLAGVATVAYTAYLGGKMVYEHGVGVERAGTLRQGAAPEIRPGNIKEATRVSAQQAAHGLRHAAADMARGDFVPEFRH